jgi:uncharacterized protein YndB with AHSA1/START domain
MVCSKISRINDMIITLISNFAALAAIAAQQTPADCMVILATADQPIVTVGTVAAPVKDVWAAWTTNEGIRSWMVASGEVDFRIGGTYRTSYSKNIDLRGPDSIENTILVFDPMRMISMKNTKTPANFPFKEAVAKTWTVIYFKEIDPLRTEVTIRLNGYDSTEESVKMKAFFVKGNQASMDALVRKFSKNDAGKSGQ